MAGVNSRWRKGAIRQSAKTTVEHLRYLPDGRGHKRKAIDSPTEKQFVERVTARTPGWVHGAKVVTPKGAK